MIDRPLIAVTTTSSPAGPYSLPRAQLNEQYVAAVEIPGATALLVTPGHAPASLRRILGLAHGLLLTGGEDVDPRCYGQAPIPQLGAVNPARDEMEMTVLDEAMRRQLPVLAVCRGMQLLNVALGGTLFQDLPTQLAGDLLHEQSAPVGDRWHHARVEPGSGLEQIFGTRDLFINSFHHQAVDRIAPSLRPTAWAPDGVVEAVEGEGYPWMYGVQWHPERGEASSPEDRRNPDRRLFYAFVRVAREFAADAGEAEPAAGAEMAGSR